MLFLLLCVLLSVSSSFPSSCFFREDCQHFTCPPPNSPGSEYYDSTDSIAYLGSHLHSGAGFAQFHESMQRAVDFVNQYPGVRYTIPLPLLHTTVKYFCCYTSDELFRISEAIIKYNWSPFNLTFDRFECNAFSKSINRTHVDLLALLSSQSNEKMMNWIQELESYVTKTTGIKIHHPRALETPFHATLAQVDLDVFPSVDDVVNELNQKLSPLQLEAMEVKWFVMERPFTVFVAKES